MQIIAILLNSFTYSALRVQIQQNRNLRVFPAMSAADFTTTISRASDDADKALEFLNLAGQLKGTPRTGWVYQGVNIAGGRVESVADHSWRMAAACFLFAGTELDVGKMVQMAVLHDMAEAITGDIAPADKVGPDEKKRREAEAMASMTNALGGFSPQGSEAVQVRNNYCARCLCASRHDVK
jgi:putative hydrolases of HD superfamily